MELHLHDDRQRRPILVVGDQQIGTAIGRHDLGQVGGLDSSLPKGRHRLAEHVAEHLGRERGPIPEQSYKGFVGQ